MSWRQMGALRSNMQPQHSAEPSPTASKAEPLLWLIPTEQVENVWPLADSYIKRAVEHGGPLVTLEDVRDGVFSGRTQLWLVWDDSREAADRCRAAIVTDKVRDVCLIRSLGGEGMDEWLHLIGRLEDWARSVGCKSLIVDGRPGWEKALKSFGYERRWVVLNKEL